MIRVEGLRVTGCFRGVHVLVQGLALQALAL